MRKRLSRSATFRACVRCGLPKRTVGQAGQTGGTNLSAGDSGEPEKKKKHNFKFEKWKHSSGGG